MANFIWTGTTDGVWTTAGNWSPAGPPGANDVALFYGPQFGGSSVSVIGGLDPGIDLNGLIVHESYAGNIGTGGGANSLNIAADLVWLMGSGRYWISSDSHAVADKIDLVIVRLPRVDSSAQVTLDSVSGAAGEIDKIIIDRGNVVLGSTITGVDVLEVNHAGNVSTDAFVTINTGSMTLTDLFLNGGEITSNVVITNARIAAGRLIQEAAVAITNLYGSGGECWYNSTGTLVLAEIGGTHVLDLTRNLKAKTVTRLIQTGLARCLAFDQALDVGVAALHTITTRQDFTKGYR